MNKIKVFLSSDYLLSISSGTKFENVYLYFSLALILGIIGFRLFLKIKGNRAEVYKKFDNVWLWGYLALGIMGLFIWFSRSQSLPLFSIRLVSYTWILLILILTGYVIYLFKTKAPKELLKYHEKKRKEKYLR